MSFPDVIVIKVMSWGYFHASRTEVRVYILIRYYLNFSLGYREFYYFPNIFLRENKKSDVKVGADECFLIVTFIFQTILNLVVVHLR